MNDLLSSRLLLADFVEHLLFGVLHLDNCAQLLLTSSLCLHIPREEEKEKKGDNETCGRSKGGISWLERGETEDKDKGNRLTCLENRVCEEESGSKRSPDKNSLACAVNSPGKAKSGGGYQQEWRLREDVQGQKGEGE